MLGFRFLAKSAWGCGPLLQDVQVNKLLEELNLRMRLTADAAVYHQWRRLQQAVAGTGGGGAGATPGAAAQTLDVGGGPAASTPLPAPSSPAPALSLRPSASGVSGAAGPVGDVSSSMVSGDVVGVGGDQREGLAQVLGLAQYEADELTAPFLTAHCILSDIGARLLVDAATTSLQRLTGRHGRWEGHGQVHQAQLLKPGVRVSYWVKAVPLLLLLGPLDGAQNMGNTTFLVPGPGPAAAAPAPTGRTAGGPPTPRPVPSIEVGVGQDGYVSALHFPSLPGSASSGPTRLPLNPAQLNLDELLLRAACSIAQAELAALHARLSSLLSKAAITPPCHLVLIQQAVPLDVVPERPGTGAACSTAGVGGVGGALGRCPCDDVLTLSSLHLSCPVLEFYAEEQLLVKVSKSLYSGRLLLQPGPGMGNDSQIDILGAWTQREDNLNVLAANSFGKVADGCPCERTLHEVCAQLCAFLRDQYRFYLVAKSVTEARQLQLHMGGPPKHLMDRFFSEHWCRWVVWGGGPWLWW